MVKVSIIIPLYNASEYIDRCLTSVINQTYKDFEVLCVDDCSSDNSVSIVQKFADSDSRVKLLHTNENSGAAKARNVGLDNVTGDFVYFIDADDWICDDYLEKMVNTIMDKNVNVVVNKNLYIEKNGHTLNYSHPGYQKLKENTFIEASENIENIFWVVWNKIYRRSFIEKYHFRFPENCPIAEDMVFQYMLFAYAGQIYYFDGPYYHYQKWDGSVSNAIDRGFGHITAFEIIYNFYKDHDMLDRNIKLYSTMPFFNVSSQELYNKYKSFFIMVIDYMNSRKDLFNEMDFFFANNILNTTSYEDYISKYPKNAAISFMGRKFKHE